ncbi:MAG: hypothetical protein GF341_04065 [candidate division Zixibacteria bacterium]|nr:hypothetical protein [candidate division Zixibacteria bacterium]
MQRLLDDGKLLVALRSVPVIIDQDSGKILGNLPDTLAIGYGSSEGTEVAAVAHEAPAGSFGDSVITVLDCATGATRGRFVPYVQGRSIGAIYYERLHPDGVHVLLIGVRSTLQDSWFVVGNVVTGETLLTHRLVYPFGEIRISPDGTLAAVTDPSRALIWDSHQTLDIFDLTTMTHVKRFDQSRLVFGVGQVRFLRDGRYLLAAHDIPYGNGPLYRIDLHALEIVDSALYPGCDSIPIYGKSCPENGAMAIGITQGSSDCGDR